MSTTTPLTASYVIDTLGLEAHPEGGYFRETFRDESSTTHDGRAASTMIYYLMEGENFSHIHRIDAAEGWHFYAGGPINIVELNDNGAKVTRLGLDLAHGERPQYLVNPGVWFGSKPADGTDWVLVGCTVAPGFEFSKFEIGKRDELLKQFPKCESWIEALTKID